MTAPARQSIVVVSDHHPAVQCVGEALEQGGYMVVPCDDAARAHAVVRASMPDLVVLDGRGAGASNRRASAMLKLDARTAAIPVLLCLADGPDAAGLTARAEETGCSILREPFEPTDLLARVRDLLG